jgi:hypothetical protein
MALNQHQAWEELDHTLDTNLTESWHAMSTALYKRDGKWESVFQLKETAGTNTKQEPQNIFDNQ